MIPDDLTSVAFVPLTRGKFAAVDVDDLPLLSQFKWAAEHKPSQGKWYATAFVRGSSGPNCRAGKRIGMHRLLASPAADQDVDHCDNDGLNNRRSNLRPCSRSFNHANRHNCKSKAGFKGVFPSKSGRRFEARVCKDGRIQHLGCFPTAEDAARAYDAAALSLFGEFAHLNFPYDVLEREKAQQAAKQEGRRTA